VSSPAALPRYERLDALRGAAIVWMVLFHFAFDLNHFGLIARQNFYTDPKWTWQRTCIVTLFLFCVGLSQAVALQQSQPRARFWRRWSQVAGCAVLVSIGSWWMFPTSWISFGVLHAIAVMLILVRSAAPLGRWLWVIGLLAIAAPQFVAHPVFDSRWTNWVGLVTRKPVTEDFVPLLPWLGVVCWGLAAGQWLLRSRARVLGGRAPGLAVLAWLGRWPLTIYMVHQPLLIGAIRAFSELTP